MSAGKEISLESDQPIHKLAIIAGSGTLPRDLYARCLELGMECHVIGFKGHTDHITPDLWGQVGKASQITQYLYNNNISDMVFIGGIATPNIRTLRIDWMTVKFFVRTWLKSFGDSNVLSSARTELEKMGFTLHGIHKFMPELLMPEGLLGQCIPDQALNNDIELGIQEAYKLGEADEGQAVLVKDGDIIARENKKGTNWMIKNHDTDGAILIKMCKPQQDMDMDLPTIGPKTVQICADSGVIGIVGEAGRMLIAQQDDVIALADTLDVFVYGSPQDNASQLDQEELHA